MRIITETTAFRRDLKRLRKRRKNLQKLLDIVRILARDGGLEEKYRPHTLSGDWKPCWECHIEPDWLLVYQVTEDTVALFRTGTHADLFG